MRQVIVYYPHKIEMGKVPKNIIVDNETDRPSRVWTLFKHRDPSVKPRLPITPMHFVNAHMEDHTHDWTWNNGELRYRSGVTGGEVWLLLEFEK